jgi:hypothetical protein
MEALKRLQQLEGILSYEANADGLSADEVINELVKQVAVA